MEERIIRTLRQQAWKRAKGELQAVLSTYWGEDDKFLLMNEEVKSFINKIEDNGLAE